MRRGSFVRSARRSIAVLGVAAITFLALAVVAGPGEAKVPGTNGRILFARFDPSVEDTFVFTANPDGSHEEPVLSQPAESPHWSPDGSQIALLSCLTPGCDTAAGIVDPDTGSVRALEMPDPSLFTACSVWAPDAKRLACEGFGQTDDQRNGIYSIRTSDGHGLTQITSNPGGDDNPIDYSPDGTRLVFGRVDPSRPAQANQALFVVRIDGGAVHRITPWGFSDDDGSWSPDGTTIVFGHGGSLWVVHPNGSGLAKLTLSGAGSHPNAFDACWSPDGTKLVFSLSTVPGIANIFTANADGTGMQQVTNDTGHAEKADWGPHPLAT
jgi:Tol biopolymer transport system component